MPLDTRHRFDTLVVGAANRLADAAARAVAEQPGAVYNPQKSDARKDVDARDAVPRRHKPKRNTKALPA